MKQIILLSLFLILTTNLFSQIPKSFRYQAVVRDPSGQICANKMISLRISILEDQENGTPVYREIHEQYVTNEYGIVAINIGQGGLVVLGNFSNILWGQHNYYMMVELDINGQTNFVLMGTSQILAVPYALYAENVINNNDPDSDPTNEIQDLYLNNDVLTITKNSQASSISLSKYLGNDTDDQNLTRTNWSADGITIGIDDGDGFVFDDYVSKRFGGSFAGPIEASNLHLSQGLTINGSGMVSFSITGNTTLRLPTEGVIVNEDYVRTYVSNYSNSNNISRNLAQGNILVGNSSGIAAPIEAYESGYILIGNGTTIRSRDVWGDGDLLNTGELVVSRIEGNVVNLGGAFSTEGNVNFVGNYTVSITSEDNTNITLPSSGLLATTDDVANFAGSNKLIALGTIGSGIWEGTPISGAFLDLSSPGPIGATNPSSGTFSLLRIGSNQISLAGSLTTLRGNITLATDESLVSNITLPSGGILANQSYVDQRTGTNITSVGVIRDGTWQGSVIENDYIHWESPGAIGSSSPSTGEFTSINVESVINLNPINDLSVLTNIREGDLIVGVNLFGSLENHIYCWLNSRWVQLD
jgi:hypothetical protein